MMTGKELVITGKYKYTNYFGKLKKQFKVVNDEDNKE